MPSTSVYWVERRSAFRRKMLVSYWWLQIGATRRKGFLKVNEGHDLQQKLAAAYVRRALTFCKQIICSANSYTCTQLKAKLSPKRKISSTRFQKQTLSRLSRIKESYIVHRLRPTALVAVKGQLRKLFIQCMQNKFSPRHSAVQRRLGFAEKCDSLVGFS